MQASEIGQVSLRGPQRGTRANADWPVPLTINFAQQRQKSTRQIASMIEP